MSILNKYKRHKNLFRILLDKYYDFVLSIDDTDIFHTDSAMTTECLTSYVDVTNPECQVGIDLASTSAFTYENCTNDNVLLEDIGFTGVDNGFVSLEDADFSFSGLPYYLSQIEMELPSGDCRLNLYKVDCNTGLHTYEVDIIGSGETFSGATLIDESISGSTLSANTLYYALKGGFFQGFYKLYGNDYQVLPNHVSDEWNLEFTLRPVDYETSGLTLNDDHEDTDGFFFYMGTRAENKFIELYGTDLSMYDDRSLSGLTYSSLTENFSAMTLDEITTSDGRSLFDRGDDFYEIPTDNKYLIYDQTSDGFKAPEQTGDAQVLYRGLKRVYKDNPYLLYHHGVSGYTVETIDEYFTNTKEEYSIDDDIKGNCFGLRITKDGRIGYRYFAKDCNSPTGWSVIEEYGFPDIVKKNEWSTIVASIRLVQGTENNCGEPMGDRKIKIYIYVNGYLKFISKELPDFDFRELNDSPEKQEGVPFNISLGGGTQGLCESILYDTLNIFPKILPIEKYFAGTFIGDIKSFKFYTCHIPFNDVKNNYYYEKIKIGE